MLEIREEIRTSKGYQVLIEMLDSYFGQDYIIRKITYDDLDPTSFDFRLSVDFPKLKGVDVVSLIAVHARCFVWVVLVLLA